MLMPPTPPNAMRSDALAGVRTRRILAVCIDLVLVSLLVAALWICLDRADASAWRCSSCI